LRQIDLSTIQGCGEELEACANGLAYMDHLWNDCIDAVDTHRETVDSYEADAAAEIRESLPKAATATEVKAAIHRWFERRPDARKARDNLREAERQKAKLERWFRTAEKRISAAQSAQNGHDRLAKHGGA
jgi:hypothetical protein